MKKSIRIGDSTIQILQEYGRVEDSILFINVHEDEQTSIDAVNFFTEKTPLHFVRLMHHQTRRIDFSIKNKAYSVDPNRIFTAKGRRKTLRDGGKFSFRASRAVKFFSMQLLDYVNDKGVVVAMHNNTDINYSINSYLPGGSESKNTRSLYINPLMDPDDFIYTTEEKYFHLLKEKKINVILQDNRRFVNDGSLSVYCGKKGIPYINIEAQKGHFDEQVRLIEEVLDLLQ
ncbi:MAG: hypothetical protein WDZ35_11295 [Crocinitomicaceae bacterium]